MRVYEIVNKGNQISKITVTPTRTTLKLGPNVSLEEQDLFARFCTFISESYDYEKLTNSLRGILERKQETLVCILLEENKKVKYRAFSVIEKNLVEHFKFEKETL